MQNKKETTEKKEEKDEMTTLSPEQLEAASGGHRRGYGWGRGPN